MKKGGAPLRQAATPANQLGGRADGREHRPVEGGGAADGQNRGRMGAGLAGRRAQWRRRAGPTAEGQRREPMGR